MDEAHGAYKNEDSQRELYHLTNGKDTWLTPASKLPRVVKSKGFMVANERFIVIMTVLPKNASDIPPWDAFKNVRQHGKNFYSAFHHKWKELINELKTLNVDAHLIILKGCLDTKPEIEIYP